MTRSLYIYFFIAFFVYVGLAFSTDWRNSLVVKSAFNLASFWSVVGEYVINRGRASRIKFPVFSSIGAMAYIFGFRPAGAIATTGFLIWDYIRLRQIASQ